MKKSIPPPATSIGGHSQLSIPIAIGINFQFLVLFSLFTIHSSLCFSQTTINISNRNGVFKFTSSTGDFENITLNAPVVFKILNSETSLRQLCIINEGYDTVVNYSSQMLAGYFQNHTDKKITVTKDGIVTGMNMIAGKRVTVPFAILLNLGGGKKYAQKVGTDRSNHDAKDTATGIAYYDAFMLARLLQKEDYKGIALLWKHYGPVADMRNNPFLDSAAVEKVISVRGVEPGEIATSFSFASLNEFGVTAINDERMQFHGKHGKGKLDASFFKRMKSFFGKHEEYKVLFPATNAFINNIKSGNYNTMLDGLRQAYFNDMGNMVTGLNQFVDLPQYQGLVQAFPEIRMTLRTAKVVSEMAETKDLKHPDVIMHELAANEEWTSLDSNLLNSW
ncbi:MAG TPA: hypothetical protein VK806_12520, partial [Bacteroidia bacterium]|nr:hypothetical protein [Bacteroidia bacterium]